MTVFFFLNDNADMTKKSLLHVGIVELAPVRVAHKLCIFPVSRTRPDKKIRAAFKDLREWVLNFGWNPDDLLHIGIPTVDGKDLVTYDCCIEFPLPLDDESAKVKQKILPGGRYAVLSIEKNPQKIAKAIRQFRGDYLHEHNIIVDEERPTYEIYYEDTMEYCVLVFD